MYYHLPSPPSLVVAKFGGTSVADAKAMLTSAQIILKSPKTKVVFVSATSGTTNTLVSIVNLVAGNPSQEVTIQSQENLQRLQEKHLFIARELSASQNIEESIVKCFQETSLVIKELQHLIELGSPLEYRLKDHILTLGERVSSILFTQALNLLGCSAELFDVTKIIRTNSHFGKAEPNLPLIKKLTQIELIPLLSKKTVYVTQGFIGADDYGRLTTLGRGGSDYSAALIAEAIDADVCEIWTDVPGIYTCDPRIVPEAKRIPEMSFDEAAELANFGAKVLHPATLWPAIRQNIAVFVGSSKVPEEGGTIIYRKTSNPPMVRAVAMRKLQTLVTVTSLQMFHMPGFLAKLFKVLADHDISVDLVTTSEVSVSLTLDGTAAGSTKASARLPESVLHTLQEFCEVNIEDNLTLVAVIGNRIYTTPGVISRTFNELNEYSIRLVCYGASEHNICLLTAAEKANEIAQKLHSELIK